LLEAFAFLAERDTVKRSVWKKTDGIFQMFNQELAHIKALFNEEKRNPPSMQAHPPFAGRAIWAMNFKTRIDTHHKLLSLCHYIPSSQGGTKDEAFITASTLSGSLEQYMQQQYGTEGVDRDLGVGVGVGVGVRNRH